MELKYIAVILYFMNRFSKNVLGSLQSIDYIWNKQETNYKLQSVASQQSERIDIYNM